MTVKGDEEMGKYLKSCEEITSLALSDSCPIFLLKVYDLTGAISPFLFKGFVKLDDKTRLEWNNR